MGMFDYFVINDKEELKNIRCAYGHQMPANQEFQTKDFDCTLSVYTLEKYKLHQSSSTLRIDSEEKIFMPYTGHVRFYTICPVCIPKKWTKQSGETMATTPFIDYVAVFRWGELVFIDPVKLETRKEIDAFMIAAGWEEET